MYSDKPDPVFEPNAIIPYNSIHLLCDFDRKLRYGKRYRELVKAHWAYVCAYCGETNESLTIDHIRPKSKNGSNDYYNLVPACPRCQFSKGSEDMEVWYFKQEFWSAERYDKIKDWMRS